MQRIIKLKPGTTFHFNIKMKMSVEESYVFDKVELGFAIENFTRNYIKQYCKDDSNVDLKLETLPHPKQ